MQYLIVKSENMSQGVFTSKGAKGDYMLSLSAPVSNKNYYIQNNCNAYMCTSLGPIKNEYVIQEMPKDYTTNQDLQNQMQMQMLTSREMNLPYIIDTINEPNTQSFVLPYYDHHTLDNYILHNQNLGESICISFIRQILNGIIQLHTKFNTNHGSLNLKKILLKSDPSIIAKYEIVLIDYKTNASEEKTVVTGDCTCKAPEFILSNKSDIYAIGCILFALMFGSLPFNGTGAQIEKSKAKEYMSIPHGKKCSAMIAYILEGCLQQDPMERISEEQLIDILNPCLWSEKQEIRFDPYNCEENIGMLCLSNFSRKLMLSRENVKGAMLNWYREYSQCPMLIKRFQEILFMEQEIKASTNKCNTPLSAQKPRSNKLYNESTPTISKNKASFDITMQVSPPLEKQQSDFKEAGSSEMKIKRNYSLQEPKEKQDDIHVIMSHPSKKFELLKSILSEHTFAELNDIERHIIAEKNVFINTDLRNAPLKNIKTFMIYDIEIDNKQIQMINRYLSSIANISTVVILCMAITRSLQVYR